MTPVQVFLVVVGLVIIALSYVISENFLNRKAEKQISKSEDFYNLSEGENSLIKKKVEELCDIEIESAIDQVEEKLSKISNEKIIAMSEFSDQILEKIEQNHTEVVFLYNMLNDKEEIIKGKELVPNKSKELVSNKDKELVPNKVSVSPQSPAKDSKEVKPQSPINTVYVDKPLDYGKELNQEDIKEQELGKKKVLQLYSEGSSVMEIAKLLEIGQGEIKLMIELARGNKNEN